jgi:hypothetical protein
MRDWRARVPHVSARHNQSGAARGAGVENFFLWIGRNPLKSPESDEGIQENPKESKPFFLGFPWFFLVRLGLAWSIRRRCP